MVPKEAEANTKAAVIAILHSPPPSWKPHFNLKMPPHLPPSLTLPHPPWTGTGQRGPPWDTSWGRSHVSTSATHRMWNMRGLVQLEPELNPAHFWDIQSLKIWGFQCNEYSQLPNREVCSALVWYYVAYIHCYKQGGKMRTTPQRGAPQTTALKSSDLLNEHTEWSSP